MRYVLQRTGGARLVLVLAFTAAYILLTALPGDAALARHGNPDLGLTPEQLAEIRAAFGADRPAVLQYLDTAVSYLTGDLGDSVQSGAAVSALLAETLPSTLTLAALGRLLDVMRAVTLEFTAAHTSLRGARAAP